MPAAEYPPGHLDIAVGRDFRWWWWRGLGERSAEGPAAKHIPMLDPGMTLQPDQLLNSDLAQLFEELVCELPEALERVLGNQLREVKPRWAKGTAHRVARLLGDHIDELERKDAQLGEAHGARRVGHV